MADRRRMILIIAYGNSLRRDDGAGLMLAEILERVWKERDLKVHRESVHQLTPELAELMAGDAISVVIFVDTRVIPPGSDSLRIEASRLASPEDLSPGMGHHMGPLTLMAYARYLYGKTPDAWLVTVPGIDFDHGEGFSDATAEALSKVGDFLEAMPRNWPLVESSLGP